MEAPARPFLLVACSANVCRSPMAGALLRHALNAEPPPLRSLGVVTAGLAAVDGEPPSRNSVEAMRKVGLSLEHHVSRRLTRSLLDSALLTLVMTTSHLQMLDYAFGPLPENLHLFRGFLSEDEDREIPDPFGRNLAAYEAARDSMVEAIPSILRHLRTLRLPPPAP